MAQTVRQNRLFVAEDYTAIYESYINANLQAYDYDTIRSAMVNYVRSTYPENFNDWIESAEFVAILDLIAQFGHNLAFRVDMNSRNNFLSTAERQDAVYKLAEFLGYQSRRNLAASGLLKVTSIRTNETVIGSQGTSLAGTEIRYENSANADNLDDFITVMNAVLAPNNQFGSPRKQASIGGINTQFYNINNTPDQIFFTLSGSVQGTSASFNAVSLSYSKARNLPLETMPNPSNAFSILYRNDGTGVTSANTGFFVGVKQGEMQYKDVDINEPIDNLSVDVEATNVNETDVWVQRINDTGDVQEIWYKVDNVFGSNIAYNALSQGERNIFSVKTRENNKISIQFADRRFGNLPRGRFRIWYRTSLNDTYVLRPEDLGSNSITFQYIGADGNPYSATMVVKLKESIVNASAGETLDDIKTNAPRIYATQDRMITASDYSSYLISQSSNILKIKSVNRTHSGHSRYIDYNDPTGAYTNVNVFGRDGKITREETIGVTKSSYSDVNRIYNENIKPILSNPNVINTYYDMNRDAFTALYADYNEKTYVWQKVITLGDITTGYITDNSNNSIQSVGLTSFDYLKHVTSDALVKFLTPDGEELWARISTINNNGLGIDNVAGLPTGKTSTGIGAISLDADIPQGSEIIMVYPAFNRDFSEQEVINIISKLDNNESFSASYDYLKRQWIFESDASLEDEGWLFFVDYVATEETNYIYTNDTYIYLESNEVVFSNTNNEAALDSYTRKKSRDLTTFIMYEGNDIKEYTVYIDSLINNNKVSLAIEDKQRDSRPDNPDVFLSILGNNQSSFNNRFEWVHVPAENELVDPSFTNIVDVFALTRTYDTAYRNYLRDTSGLIDEPVPPTIDELNQQFKQVNTKKAMSDKIIYRPVRYRPLFGPKASYENRGRLRVVKVAGSNMTDNEIRSRVVQYVGEFFNLSNWDFGETFYFTELAAYVHGKMPGIVSSLVIIPEFNNSVFGDLFQIEAKTDEIFIPDVGVDIVDIIDSINDSTIKTA